MHAFGSSTDLLDPFAAPDKGCEQFLQTASLHAVVSVHMHSLVKGCIRYNRRERKVHVRQPLAQCINDRYKGYNDRYNGYNDRYNGYNDRYNGICTTEICGFVWNCHRRFKLGDFGLAIDTTLERSKSRVGTLDYMSPEVSHCVQHLFVRGSPASMQHTPVVIVAS